MHLVSGNTKVKDNLNLNGEPLVKAFNKEPLR